MTGIDFQTLKRLQQDLNIPTAIEIGKGTKLPFTVDGSFSPSDGFKGLPVRTNPHLPEGVALIKSGSKITKVIALTEEAKTSARTIAYLVEQGGYDSVM